LDKTANSIRFVGGSRWHRFTVVAGFLLALSYTLGVLIQISMAPSLGIHCLFSTRLLSLDTSYLDPVDQPGLPEGGQILSLGEQPVTTWPSLLRLLSKPDQLTNDQGLVSLVVGTASGESQAVTLHPREPHLANLAPTLAWLVPKLALVVVAGALLWRSPHSIPRQFFLLSLSSLIAYFGGFHWTRIAPNPWIFVPFLLAASFLPVVSLHFNLIYPRQNTLYSRFRVPTLFGLYLPPTLFFVYGMVEYWHIKGLSLAARDSDGILLVEESLKLLADAIHVYMAFGFLCFLGGIWALLASFQRATTETEKNQVKWILYGAFGSSVPLAYSLYLVFLDPDKFGQGGAIWPMFIASLVMTVAYSISLTGYGLMQIDRMLSTGFLRFLTSALVGAGYYLVVLLTFLIVSQVGMVDHSWPQAIAGGVAALLIAIMLDIARSRLKRLLDRRLRRDRQILEETLQQMTRTIDSLLDEGQLAQTFLPIAVDLIRTRSGAVYLLEPGPSEGEGVGSLEIATKGNRPRMRLRARFGNWKGPEEIALLTGIETGEQRSIPPGLLPPSRQGRPQDLGLTQPLVHDGRPLGALFLAEPSEGPLTREEKNQVQALAKVASLALASTRGHRQIDALSREMQSKVDKIAEQQRRILSLQTQLRTRTAPPEGTASTDGEPASPQKSPNPSGILGASPGIQRVIHQIQKVANSGTTVLIQGESGTGKELVAQAIHENSPRSQKPFIRVHCGALSTALLESELFGHVRGAFTSAFSDKMGRFEAAQGGTIFLDEIGDIGAELQVKLLRVLQEKTIERVGSNEPIRVDVRVVAATHRDLESMVASGQFRQDLYYRLRVFPIVVPPLRERIEDIPELVQAFVEKSAAATGRRINGIEDDALVLLKSHDWPGNIRELQHCVESAVVLSEFDLLTEEDFQIPGSGHAPAPGGPGHHQVATAAKRQDPTDRRQTQDKTTSIQPGETAEALRAVEETRQREELLQALRLARGNKSAAARRLGVPRSTLVSQLKKHQLD